MWLKWKSTFIEDNFDNILKQGKPYEVEDIVIE